MKKKKLTFIRPFAATMACTVAFGLCPTGVFAAESEDLALDTVIQSVMIEETEDVTPEENVQAEEYRYVYAGLSWAEFWASEGVYLAPGSGMTDSSNLLDQKGETDRGAFDAVSRATTTHGLHRGSYQCRAVIYDTEGNSYEVSYWTGQKDAVLTDGSAINFSGGTITYTKDGAEVTATMDHYEVSGIKYVPVEVKAEDYDSFCQQYPVTENDQTVAGGFSEKSLSAYSKTAQVTSQTNGLKTAVKKEDGTFSFTARRSGGDSGIAGEAQKQASNIVVDVRTASGSYGEFLRVDLNGEGYGDLGANMYAVRWDYYGADSTYSNALVSYGTKFAADNWMHKSNGIQLGLTDSLRCQLPKGTDGTGYWAITVYAMGYEDYTFQFQATADNIVEPEENEEVNVDALKAAIEQATALNENDYTAESWANMKLELDEAKEELAAPHTQATVDEAVEHLQSAVTSLVKKPQVEKLTAPTAKAASAGYNSVKVTWNKVKGADGYRIYRAASKNGKYSAVKTLSSGQTASYTDGKLTAGQTYYYKVRAYQKTESGNVFGDLSKVVSAKPVPAKAAIASASNTSGKKAVIKWKKVSGASGYEVYRAASKNGKYSMVTRLTSSSKVSCTNTGLQKGKTYYYKVRAYRTVNGKRVYGAFSSVKNVKITK